MTHHGHAAHYCSYAQARLPSFLSALLKRHWTQVTLVKVNIINSRLPCADMVCSLKAGLLCPGLPSHSSKSPVCHRRTWNIQRTDWRFLVTWDASCKGRVWQQPLEHCFKMFQTCAAIRSNTVRRKRIKEDQRGLSACCSFSSSFRFSSIRCCTRLTSWGCTICWSDNSNHTERECDNICPLQLKYHSNLARIHSFLDVLPF